MKRALAGIRRKIGINRAMRPREGAGYAGHRLAEKAAEAEVYYRHHPEKLQQGWELARTLADKTAGGTAWKD